MLYGVFGALDDGAERGGGWSPPKGGGGQVGSDPQVCSQMKVKKGILATPKCN